MVMVATPARPWSVVADNEEESPTLGAEIGLVEHVALVVKTEQVAHRIRLLNGEEIVEGALARGRVDPFQSRAIYVASALNL